jgi:hypothetical protein
LVDCRENFPPMPERNSNFFQILIGQKRQYRNVDFVFYETFSVLGQAELIEPFGNLLHCRLCTMPQSSTGNVS